MKRARLSGGSMARTGAGSVRQRQRRRRWCERGARRRVTRAVGGTLRSRALPHRDRGESDFHAGNDSDRPRCLGPAAATNCQLYTAAATTPTGQTLLPPTRYSLHATRPYDKPPQVSTALKHYIFTNYLHLNSQLRIPDVPLRVTKLYRYS